MSEKLSDWLGDRGEEVRQGKELPAAHCFDEQADRAEELEAEVKRLQEIGRELVRKRQAAEEELAALRPRAERGERLRDAATADGLFLAHSWRHFVDIAVRAGDAALAQRCMAIAAALDEEEEAVDNIPEEARPMSKDTSRNLTEWEDVFGCEWAEALHGFLAGDDVPLWKLIHDLWERAERAEKSDRVDRLITALGMFSENMQRQQNGYAMAYCDNDFFGLIPDLAADAAEAAALDETPEEAHPDG